jgi:uncharacterized Zn finger protein
MAWYADAEELTAQRAAVQGELERRRAEGQALEPVRLPSQKLQLSGTFWGQAWNRHLQAYAVYEARLPKGRTLLRKGQVLDLMVHSGQVTALVVDDRVYEVKIALQPLAVERWQALVLAAQGQVPSMLDLLTGQLGEGLLRLLTDPKQGLLPELAEIRCQCPCLDDADLCKHAAGLLYAVGVRLDTQPEALFTLRQVVAEQLLQEASRTAATELVQPGQDELAGADLQALFGIQLG